MLKEVDDHIKGKFPSKIEKGDKQWEEAAKN